MLNIDDYKKELIKSLKKHKAFGEYISEMIKSTETSFENILDVTFNRNNFNILVYSFVWCRSYKGTDYWKRIDKILKYEANEKL